MRNSEPDSKHFVESLDFLRIPCQNPQKPPQNCAIYLLCGFLRNWSVIISILCGHKIALPSHRCHFKAIASWKVLFKPQLHMTGGTTTTLFGETHLGSTRRNGFKLRGSHLSRNWLGIGQIHGTKLRVRASAFAMGSASPTHRAFQSLSSEGQVLANFWRGFSPDVSLDRDDCL